MPPQAETRGTSMMQQVEECTRLAVLHLTERVSPITTSPLLRLLNDMSYRFTSSRRTESDIFDVLESSNHSDSQRRKRRALHGGIGEIGVCFIDIKEERPPQHYTILSRSITGRSSGNLAKHGPRKTCLFYRDANEHEKAITAICLIDTSNGEEPPLGFEVVAQTPGASDANLTWKQKGSPSIHLCVHRGNGPPITDLGVVHIKKEKLPVGWHFINRTTNGKPPQLDAGHTVLAYKRDYLSVLGQFRKYMATQHREHRLLAQCVAILVCGIYSFDRQTFLHALEAFTILEPLEDFPAELLAAFIGVVRDSVTAYISYFPRGTYSKVLKWANHVYDSRCASRQINNRALIDLLHLCMFLRYDDVREESSLRIINKLIAEWTNDRALRSVRCRPQSPPLSPSKAGHFWKGNVYDAMRSMVCELVDHVEMVKVTEDDITKYLNVRCLCPEFDQWTAEWVHSLYRRHGHSHRSDGGERYYSELMSCAMVVLAKVSSQELPDRFTAKSETIKRRIHGMKLLSVFLAQSEHYVHDSPLPTLLLRRVVFTSFVYNAITPIPALFKKMMAIFKILWSSYRTVLKFEIGVLLDLGIIGLLQSKWCTSPQKIDLLRGLLDIFQNRGALINIFYNFDNDTTHWPICSKLVDALAKLTEHDLRDCDHQKLLVIHHALMLLARFMQLIAKYLKAPHLSAGGNIDEQENFDTLGGGLEAMMRWGSMMQQQQQSGPGRPASVALLSLYSGVSGMSGMSGSSQYQPFDDRPAPRYPERPSQSLNTAQTKTCTATTSHSDSSFGSRKVPDAVAPLAIASNLPVPETKEAAVSSSRGTIGTTATVPSVADPQGIGPSLRRVHDHEDAEHGVEEKRVEFAEVIPSSIPLQSRRAVEEEERKGDYPVDEEGNVMMAPPINRPTLLLDDTEAVLWTPNDTLEAIAIRPLSLNDEFVGDFQPRFVGLGRRSSAVMRHNLHQEENLILAKALKKANEDKLKSAIKFLVSQHSNPKQQHRKFSTLQYIAEFLYNNETLDKEEIGEFIGALDSGSLFSERQHAQLLMLYVSQLNFVGQSFDTAFRHFLTDSGFRLPKEAQKIERLLVAFSKIFIKHNAHYFDGSDETALLLAYGMLMLNTDLHNPNMKLAGAIQMTKQQFQQRLHSADKKLDRKMLSAIYHSVKDNPIQMDTEQYGDEGEKGGGSKGSKGGKHRKGAASSNQWAHNQAVFRQNQFRKECASLVSRSLAKLRDHSLRKHSWQKARRRTIVKTLFGVTWHRFLGAVTTILQQSEDPSTQSICLDAIKYCCASAICLHLCDPELYAFLCDLARFVFMEENKHLMVRVRQMGTIRGEHLKAEWFVNVMNHSKTSNIKTACQVMAHVVNDMKARVQYDADQKRLRDIEQELGASLFLVHPDRKFIFSGNLIKQSSKGELDQYRFFLFNDLLLYVSGNAGNFTVHRVLHLSLCQVLDVKDGEVRKLKNLFRVISPQKSILLMAETSREKHEWFQLMEGAIAKQEEQRARWINENYQTLQEYHETARVSKFVGRTSKPKKHELHRVQNGKAVKNDRDLHPDVMYEIKVFFERSTPCKLCARPFRRFTRKSRCPWCLDQICKDCYRKKTSLPEKAKKDGLIKVCDACFGAIDHFALHRDDQAATSTLNREQTSEFPSL